MKHRCRWFAIRLFTPDQSRQSRPPLGIPHRRSLRVRRELHRSLHRASPGLPLPHCNANSVSPQRHLRSGNTDDARAEFQPADGHRRTPDWRSDGSGESGSAGDPSRLDAQLRQGNASGNTDFGNFEPDTAAARDRPARHLDDSDRRHRHCSRQCTGLRGAASRTRPRFLWPGIVPTPPKRSAGRLAITGLGLSLAAIGIGISLAPPDGRPQIRWHRSRSPSMPTSRSLPQTPTFVARIVKCATH